MTAETGTSPSCQRPMVRSDPDVGRMAKIVVGNLEVLRWICF